MNYKDLPKAHRLKAVAMAIDPRTANVTTVDDAALLFDKGCSNFSKDPNSAGVNTKPYLNL